MQQDSESESDETPSFQVQKSKEGLKCDHTVFIRHLSKALFKLYKAGMHLLSSLQYKYEGGRQYLANTHTQDIHFYDKLVEM